MNDVVTIVIVHISRQQDQPLLHVGQDLRLKAGANFLQRINKAGISSDWTFPFKPSR